MKFERGDDGFWAATLTASQINAMVAFASTDKSRPTIACVCFVPEWSHVVSTDGHALGLLHQGDDVSYGHGKEPAQWLVPAAELKAAIRGMKAGDEVRLTFGADTVKCSRGATVTVLTRHTALPFPAYRDIIPAREQSFSQVARKWGVNVSYLARLSRISDATACSGKARIPSWTMRTPSDQLAPMRCDARGSACSATAVIMPMNLGL